MLINAGLGDAQGSGGETSVPDNVGSRVVGTVNVVVSDDQLLVGGGNRSCCG